MCLKEPMTIQMTRSMYNVIEMKTAKQFVDFLKRRVDRRYNDKNIQISFLYLITFQYTNQRGTKRYIQMLPTNKICISSAGKIKNLS